MKTNQMIRDVEIVEHVYRLLFHPDSVVMDLTRHVRGLIASNERLLDACKLALARIESDIESPASKVREGDALRAAIKENA